MAVDEFVPGIEQVLASVDDAGESDWCATFECPGRDIAWAQVTSDCLNLGYPLADDPAEALPAAGLLPAFVSEILAWEANQYVTLQFQNAGAKALAAFLDRYFSKVLVADADNYTLNVRVEDLG